MSVWSTSSFTITHADSGAFEGAGLRPFFEYRQLGIPEATGGKFGAHVIRAVPGMESPGTWHTHDLDFQMVYVTKGWVVFEYEGEGEHVLRAGSCVLQPSGIRHREVRHSDDMELIEIVSPAEVKGTFAVTASLAADGAMKLVVAGQDAVAGKAKGTLPRQPAEDFCVGHDNAKPVGLYGELKPLQGAVSGLAVTTP